jgi:hypothetical protein
MTAARNATDISRDEFCYGLLDLYGYEPTMWDGLSYAEITQDLSTDQLNRVYSYLGATV